MSDENQTKDVKKGRDTLLLQINADTNVQIGIQEELDKMSSTLCMVTEHGCPISNRVSLPLHWEGLDNLGSRFPGLFSQLFLSSLSELQAAIHH